MDSIKAFVSQRLDSKPRKIYAEEDNLTDKQKMFIEWDRCYKGELFKSPKRKYPWGSKTTPLGTPVNPDMWKPIYVPSIAKDMVTTMASYIVGTDKFCSINVTTTEVDLFEALDIPLGYEEDEDAGRAKAQAEALQKFVTAILEQADIQGAVSNVLEQALPKGDGAMLVRYWGNRMWYTVPNRTWAHWVFSQEDPSDINSYNELYFFKRDGDLDENGDKQKYIFLREIDETNWREYEIPLIRDKHGTSQLKMGDPKTLFDAPHHMGSCPVVAYENTNKCSVFENEIMENIRAYIEYKNDIKAGIRKNMNPQWVLMKDSDQDSQMRAALPGGGNDKKKPLTQGKLWELAGKSIQSFANGTEGFEMAMKDSENDRFEIRASANIIDIPDDNEQSGKALALRLAPHYSKIDRLRGGIGKAIKTTVRKTLDGAMYRRESLDLGEDVHIPKKLGGYRISLDWGSLMPVTPEMIKEETANIREMDDAGYISKKSGAGYLLPLVNIEDPDAESRQIELERKKNEENQVAMAEAAFKSMGAEE